ncbi:MAG: helix-hairpin-helix domain-containing protein, partial [Firmicutes bacterium]|nr:helix-hairpin-helix domain-containing protein [Bacillota bacterium]
SFQGLGGSAADNIVEAREEGEFKTIEDFKDRTKVSKTVIELMRDAGVFEGLPETNKLSIFDLGLA